MTRLPWQRTLRIVAMLFALLAGSNLLKPVQLWGVHTGFVLFGHRLSGTANALVGPLFGLYLLVYALVSGARGFLPSRWPTPTRPT